MMKARHRESVLLIEDNPGFRFLFKEALEYLGHKVLEAEDGETGLESAKNNLPDLIFLDLMIPKMDGFEVLKKLKAEPSTRPIHVVILSVLNEPRDIQKSFELGADKYIVKGSEAPEKIVRSSCELLAS